MIETKRAMTPFAIEMGMFILHGTVTIVLTYSILHRSTSIVYTMNETVEEEE